MINNNALLSVVTSMSFGTNLKYLHLLHLYVLASSIKKIRMLGNIHLVQLLWDCKDLVLQRVRSVQVS